MQGTIDRKCKMKIEKTQFLVWLLAFSLGAVRCEFDLNRSARMETSELCVDADQSCTDSACWSVKTECSTTSLLEKCTEVDCGLFVNLYRFQHPQYPLRIQSTLNITTPNTYKDLEFVISRANRKECHNITINRSFTPSANQSLFYDCRRDIIIPHVSTLLSATFNMKNIEYLLNITTEQELANNSIFFYYHVFVNTPTITFQENEMDTEYIITLNKILPGRGQTELTSVVVNISDPSTYITKWNQSITVQIGKQLFVGNYSISIAPSNCNDTCSKSYLFFEIKEESSGSFTIAIIILIILLTGFLIPLVIYCQQQQFLKQLPGKMLLAFDPVSKSHTQAVRAAQIFMMELLDTEVFLDVIDIPKTAHKDPALWYQDTIESVDYVAVVVPSSRVDEEARGSPYRQTFALCLDLVEKRWNNILKKGVSPGKDGCVLILLSDSDPNQIPKECRFWPRFYLPKESLLLRQHLQFHGPTSQKKWFHFKLPASLLPISDASKQRFDEILHHIKTQNQIAETAVEVEPVQQDSDVRPDLEVLPQSNEPNQTRNQDYGEYPSIRDIKLIDDSSSSSGEIEDAAHNDDESSKLNPSGDQMKWNII